MFYGIIPRTLEFLPLIPALFDCSMLEDAYCTQLNTLGMCFQDERLPTTINKTSIKTITDPSKKNTENGSSKKAPTRTPDARSQRKQLLHRDDGWDLHGVQCRGWEDGSVVGSKRNPKGFWVLLLPELFQFLIFRVLLFLTSHFNREQKRRKRKKKAQSLGV